MSHAKKYWTKSVSRFVLGVSMGTLGLAGCSVKQGSIPMVGPIPEVKSGETLTEKHPSHTSYVQCGDEQLEVLLDVTGSDLENQLLKNSPVSIRDLNSAASAYSTITTDTITEVTWGTMQDPEIRGFQLASQSGMGLMISTHDFKSGQGLYTGGPNQAAHVMNCSFFTGGAPAPLAAPAPTPAPAPMPANPDGGIPATGSSDAKYLQCKGTEFEVYADFSRVDLAGWNHVGNAHYGLRPVGESSGRFGFYGNSMSSSYQMGGTSYASLNASNEAGDQLDLSLSTAGFVTAIVKIAVKEGGKRTDDRMTCQWIQNNIYSGQFGW